jgi:rhodanese-related sulfurtransferase
MKKYANYLMIMLIVPVLVISSCKKPETTKEETGTFSDLKSYVMAEGLDLTDVLINGWVKPASAVVDTSDFTIPDWYVMDIRSSSDFAAGHIKGAVNVALKDVLVKAPEANGKKILVVCKTGQTAGQAVMALRLSGYSDAAVLKFGMAGWNPQFEAPWTNNIGNMADDFPAEWNNNASASLESFSNPDWETTATEGKEILQERIQQMLDNGFPNVNSTDVFGNQENYQIFNFWTATDYTTFGHFSTAQQLKPISFANDVSKAIDPETTTLVYCFTGQTSSMIVAWLNVMGYDAKSILFGVNKLKYNELKAANKPHWHGAANYEFVSN